LFDIKMLEFFIDNIFGMFDGCVIQQRDGIPIGTNCAPVLSDLCTYSYKADFIQGLLMKIEKKASTIL
jgi:hypothetical protein